MFAVLHHPGGLSTTEEVYQQPGADGGNKECLKPATMVLWLMVLWLKYKEVDPSDTRVVRGGHKVSGPLTP